MSGRMTPIPFGTLMSILLNGLNANIGAFGIMSPYRHHGKPVDFLGEKLEIPLGPAAGPHTQLAQNIITAYLCGARFFELKTVQVLDGEDIKVSKPCIDALDEGYNVEWSTELRVSEAMDEYIKAWFALKLISAEFKLGSSDGFIFNMSVGYDFKGITSPKIDSFICGMKDASSIAIWSECISWSAENIKLFKKIDMQYINSISPHVCSSVTLSTLHGCPADEIEKICAYLVEKKHLNTFLKCNPTLVGYEFARTTLNGLGYDYISFDRHHFDEDIGYKEIIGVIKRLITKAERLGLTFGIKLTNTFPVKNTKNVMRGGEMYMSGRPLFPLTAQVAHRLSADLGDNLCISWSSGVDVTNMCELYRAGIWPLTVATTLLKPGGYMRLKQMASVMAACGVSERTHVNIETLNSLSAEACSGKAYAKCHLNDIQRSMLQGPPLFDCFIAPCTIGCPIGQDIPGYLAAVRGQRYVDALKIILNKNPLPFITGTICYHHCTELCTRNFYDEPLKIRSAKLEAAEKGIAGILAEMKPTALKTEASAAIIGGGPAGLAAAYFLRRFGIRAVVFEKENSLGGVVRRLLSKQGKISDEAIESDISIVRSVGVEFALGTEVKSVETLYKSGYTYIIVASGNAKINNELYIPPDSKYIYCAGDVRHDAPASVADAISDARRVCGQIAAIEGITQDCAVASASKRFISSLQAAERGKIKYAFETVCDAERCLECSKTCENCVDVCPNRANIAVKLPNEDIPQIAHIDALCNECGNCASFCPWQGAPYREKFTYFSREDDFLDSDNQGFYLIEAGRVKIRLDGKVMVASLESAELPDRIRKLIKAVLSVGDFKGDELYHV